MRICFRLSSWSASGAHGARLQRHGPQRLLSGLLKCSCCGSSIVACGNGRGGRRRGQCTRARESGSCQNSQTFYLDVIEEAVLTGLVDQLMHPDVIAVAVKEYHAELRRLEGENSRTRIVDEKRLLDLRKSIDKLIDAVAAGDLPASAVGRKVAELEAEAEELDRRLEANPPPPDVITLHPKVLDYYLTAVRMLSQTLSARNDHQAIKPVRELVDSIIVYPRAAGEELRFDVKGRLAAILNMAEEGKPIRAGKGVVGLMVPWDWDTGNHYAGAPLFILRYGTGISRFPAFLVFPVGFPLPNRRGLNIVLFRLRDWVRPATAGIRHGRPSKVSRHRRHHPGPVRPSPGATPAAAAARTAAHHRPVAGQRRHLGSGLL